MYTADTQLSVSVRGKLWKAGISREMSIQLVAENIQNKKNHPLEGVFFRIKF